MCIETLRKFFRCYRSIRSLDLHSVAAYARQLHLVQYQSLEWITPRLLYPILHQFAAFRNVSSLSLHSLSIELFDAADVKAIFGHFFPTVRSLDLEGPRAKATSLLEFLLHFQALDDLGISDPEWDHESATPLTGRQVWPPLRGTLHFRGVRADSVEFIDLLTGIPIAFRHVCLVCCQLPPALINQLLDRTSSCLKTFSISTWFRGGSCEASTSSAVLLTTRSQAIVVMQSIFPAAIKLKSYCSSPEWYQWRISL